MRVEEILRKKEELRKIFGEDLDAVVNKALERGKKLGEKERESYLLGYIHGYYITPFIREVLKDAEAVVGVGRDAVPLLRLAQLEGTPVFYLGVSRGGETHRALVNAFYSLQGGLAESVERHLKETPELLSVVESIARRLRKKGVRRVVVIDMGMRGTHSLPVAFLLRRKGFDAKSALVFAHEDYKDLHDAVAYVLPSLGAAGITGINERIPHPVPPFDNPRRLSPYVDWEKHRKNIPLWIAYMKGLKDGWRERR